jgi:branched-chain amino acid transport system substrate-binding protein
MKKLLALILTVMLVLGASSAALAATIKIGGIAPLTAAASASASWCRPARDLAVDEFNAIGALGQHRLGFPGWGTHDAVEATNAYNQLVSNGIAALIGPVTTTPTLAVAERAAADNMPMITASATAYDVTSAGKNVFRACFLDPFQAELMAQYAAENLGARWWRCSLTTPTTTPSACPTPSRRRPRRWAWKSWRPSPPWPATRTIPRS